MFNFKFGTSLNDLPVFAFVESIFDFMWPNNEIVVVCFLLGDSPAQTPGNHPKENKQHSEHGESLKSRMK